MYAQDLRRWRSILMYLYQIYLILFSFWWLGASAMHLTPVSQASAHRSDWLRSPISSAATLLANIEPHQLPPNSSYLISSVLRINDNRNINNSKSSHSGKHLRINNTKNHLNSDQITHLHQISVSVKPLQRVRSVQQSAPAQVSSTSSALRRRQYDAYSKKQWERKHMKANIDDLTARSRRDSRLNRRKNKRYCSAHDPQALAFEAPTVIVAKVKSRSHDRSSNYSVNFEYIKTFKHDTGFTIPSQVRLNFVNRNKTTCNIFNEEFRPIGIVKYEPLLGGHYFLFLKQLDLGNFKILGSPIPFDDKTQKAVIRAVRNNYGE